MTPQSRCGVGQACWSDSGPEQKDSFEHFLTATVLTHCLDGFDRASKNSGDVEGLIERLTRVLRSAAQSATSAQRTRSNALPRHKLRAVVAHVANHLHRPIPVAELAALVCISPFHFSRQFRAATGLAPHQYVLQCRMRQAAQMLVETELTVCSVANEVGCVDQSHFTNVFRRNFGCTPSEFRKSMWNNAIATSVDPRA